MRRTEGGLSEAGQDGPASPIQDPVSMEDLREACPSDSDEGVWQARGEV